MITERTVCKGGAAYTLRVHTQRQPSSGEREQPIWFVNEAGEGMSMSEKNLFDILDAAFKAEF